MGVEIWPYGLINHLKSLLWNEIFTFFNLVFLFSYFGLLYCPVSKIVDWESLWHYCQRQNLFINMRTCGINYNFYSWQPTLGCVKILFLVLYSLCTGVIPYSIVKIFEGKNFDITILYLTTHVEWSKKFFCLILI